MSRYTRSTSRLYLMLANIGVVSLVFTPCCLLRRSVVSITTHREIKSVRSFLIFGCDIHHLLSVVRVVSVVVVKQPFVAASMCNACSS